MNDPKRFHARIRQVFRLAQQAIDEELTRQQQASGTAIHGTTGTTPPEPPKAANGTEGNRAGTSHTNGNGSTANGNGSRNGNGSNGHGASAKQMDYARQLAKAISGLGVRRLETLCRRCTANPWLGSPAWMRAT